jgi:hypothetical protein
MSKIRPSDNGVVYDAVGEGGGEEEDGSLPPPSIRQAALVSFECKS